MTFGRMWKKPKDRTEAQADRQTDRGRPTQTNRQS